MVKGSTDQAQTFTTCFRFLKGSNYHFITAQEFYL